MQSVSYLAEMSTKHNYALEWLVQNAAISHSHGELSPHSFILFFACNIQFCAIKHYLCKQEL